MRKISLKLNEVSNNTKSIRIRLIGKENLLALDINSKINDSKSFLNIEEEKLLIEPLLKKAIEFLKDQGFQIEYILNVYWIKCISPKNQKLCYKLELLY